MTDKSFLGWRGFSGRSTRLAVLMGFLGVTLLLSVLQVSYTYHRSGKHHYLEAQALIRWIDGNRHRIADDTTSLQQHTKSLLERVGDKANLHSLSQERIQPRGEHRLQVWMHEVPFESLMRWFGDLADEGIDVLSVQIDRTDRNGHVNVQCLLVDRGN